MIIVVTNLKGGSGKATTAISLACAGTSIHPPPEHARVASV